MTECLGVLWEDTESEFRCELEQGCTVLGLRADAQAYRDAHPNRRQPPHWTRAANGEAEEYGGEA
jgi:hypothetical protein